MMNNNNWSVCIQRDDKCLSSWYKIYLGTEKGHITVGLRWISNFKNCKSSVTKWMTLTQVINWRSWGIYTAQCSVIFVCLFVFIACGGSFQTYATGLTVKDDLEGWAAIHVFTILWCLLRSRLQYKQLYCQVSAKYTHHTFMPVIKHH